MRNNRPQQTRGGINGCYAESHGGRERNAMRAPPPPKKTSDANILLVILEHKSSNKK